MMIVRRFMRPGRRIPRLKIPLADRAVERCERDKWLDRDVSCAGRLIVVKRWPGEGSKPPTSSFAFEDDLVAAVANREIEATAVTPTTVGWFNLQHADKPLRLAARWRVARNIV
ncbi:hypothetical protein [Bradyrhizobium sp. JYMT SZCCT0180]|uniref:hypothetical protein n=1 Tax=Bradyrhizobium sp. JYMT SZCCT0180 TaxID=2807666 RepID=UPI001BAA3AF2|nr:hypothetical protein [Bradyrhizobium sp. JYMT SZCCT0180]MBR1213817.1 hypothetical protein [Bradyrhizobium sp. JYMT SZCCT0180]